MKPRTTLKKVDGTKAIDAKDKAEALNEFFGSVYQQESNICPPVTKNYKDTPPPLSFMKVTDEMVMKKLKSLSPGKSTVPDGWHPYLLQSLPDRLCVPLRILINKPLNEWYPRNGWRCVWAYGVVVSMFDFHRSDRGSNPGRGGKIS